MNMTLLILTILIVLICNTCVLSVLLLYKTNKEIYDKITTICVVFLYVVVHSLIALTIIGYFKGVVK